MNCKEILYAVKPGIYPNMGVRVFPCTAILWAMWVTVWAMFFGVNDPQKSECLCGFPGIVGNVGNVLYYL